MTDDAPAPPEGDDLRARASLDTTDATILAAIVAGQTRSEAAAAASVHVATVYRRLQEPTFQRALAEARNEILDASIDRSRRAVSRALDTLIEIMEDRGQAGGTRVAAARAALSALVSPGAEPRFQDDDLETPEIMRAKIDLELAELEVRLRELPAPGGAPA